jgi:8-oxo-dGTP pyrophosphatase MutT (NUDIX family)
MLPENNDMVQKWEVLSRRIAVDYRLFRIEEKKVRSPRTGAAMDVQAIHFPDWVVVLPITRQQTVVMIHQYRHGNEQICLELPGGLVDPDDHFPERSARRELMEETGYRSDRIVKIGETYPQPAVLNNRCFFFMASEAKRVGGPDLDAGEDISLVEVPMDDIPGMIRQGDIKNAMTELAFSYYWMTMSS